MIHRGINVRWRLFLVGRGIDLSLRDGLLSGCNQENSQNVRPKTHRRLPRARLTLHLLPSHRLKSRERYKSNTGETQVDGTFHWGGIDHLRKLDFLRATFVSRMVIESKGRNQEEPVKFTKNSMPDKAPTPDEKLQQEFNRWAAAGEGAKMEQHHLDITEKTIRLMNLRPGERVLDLGCGSGWATRLLARLVGDGPEGFGQVVGLDVSDEMVRQAREASKDFDNILYVWGSAQQIPWEENFFDKVLSVESFYYYPDQDRALKELFRVMAPRGQAVHPDQSLQRQSVFAAVGRQAEGSGACALCGGIFELLRSMPLRMSKRGVFLTTRPRRMTIRRNPSTVWRICGLSSGKARCC